MADVTDERAQLLLVGALALAVLFVALALLMNAAIHTENVATRDVDAGTAEAIRYRSAVETGTAGLVRAVNRRSDASYDALAANLSAGVGSLNEAAGIHEAYEGDAATVSLVGVTNGSRIEHANASRAFETGAADANDPTPENWTLVPDVTGTRAFAANVTRGALANTTDVGGSVFRVVVTDGSETWTAYVYDDITANAVNVKVRNGSNPISDGQCLGPVGADHVVVDFTGGTVGGEPCPLLDFAKGVSGPYAISFENGDMAAGTYGLVVRGSSLDGGPDPAFTADPNDGPAVSPAIYDATVAVAYEGPQVEYRTNVTVAPGVES